MPVQRGAALDPEATKAKVLKAAGELFYERGVHAVGVNDIAARANASKLSIYRYFQSKEGLVAAMVAQRSEQTHEELAAELAGIAPGAQRVLALFDAIRRGFTKNGYRGCPVINTSIDTRNQDEDVRTIARTHLNRYRKLLVAELEHGGFEKPRELAKQLTVLIEGAMVISAVERSNEAGNHARAAAESLLGLGAPRAH
ncbi:TetR/AcrR family transcriptional regulator [Sciscionella marina]|uniref:TetR/AcrR family transcriptional regulator n=1 Tax=Sciscionella marina TaxID=508770 RepID=UPI00036D1E66|nr:TetR/AcrR family transcriptional regulator [Sciscionella marina]